MSVGLVSETSGELWAFFSTCLFHEVVLTIFVHVNLVISSCSCLCLYWGSEEGTELFPKWGISYLLLSQQCYSVEGCISLIFFCLLEYLSPQSQVSLLCDISSVALIIAPACLGWHFLYFWHQFLLILLSVRRYLTTSCLFKGWHQWAPTLLSL